MEGDACTDFVIDDKNCCIFRENEIHNGVCVPSTERQVMEARARKRLRISIMFF